MKDYDFAMRDTKDIFKKKDRLLVLIVIGSILISACNQKSEQDLTHSSSSASTKRPNGFNEYINERYNYMFIYPNFMKLTGLNIDENQENAPSVALYFTPLEDFSALIIDIDSSSSDVNKKQYCKERFYENKSNIMSGTTLLNRKIDGEYACSFDVLDKYQYPTSHSVVENPTRLIFTFHNKNVFVFLYPIKGANVAEQILTTYRWTE